MEARGAAIPLWAVVSLLVGILFPAMWFFQGVYLNPDRSTLLLVFFWLDGLAEFCHFLCI